MNNTAEPQKNGEFDKPAGFKEVLQKEQEKIRSENNPIGLAFSGGGIRSATFNLGLIQAFARKKLLHRFDYLSAVSGGSYIGSWLISWAYREKEANPIDQKSGIELVQDKLNADSISDQDHKYAEPREISWLRRHSNYLTPQKGLFSSDTLTNLTYHIRNVLLSSVVTGLFAFGAMALFAALMLFVGEYAIKQSVAGIELAVIAQIAGLMIGFFATARMWFYMPLMGGTLKDKPYVSFSGKEHTVTTIALAITLFAISLGILGSQSTDLEWILPLGYWIAALLGISSAWNNQQGEVVTQTNWIWLSLSAFIGSLSLGILGWLLPKIPVWVNGILFNHAEGLKSDSIWFLAGIVNPIVCLLLTLAVSIHLGLIGRAISAEAYLWVSRVAARVAQFSLAFALPAIIFLFLPPLFDWLDATIVASGSVAIYAIIIRGLVASSSMMGSGANRASKLATMLKDILVSTAPFILILALAGFVSLGVRTSFEQDKAILGQELNDFQWSCHKKLVPLTESLTAQPNPSSKDITYQSIRYGLQGYGWEEKDSQHPVDCVPSFKDFYHLNILSLNSMKEKIFSKEFMIMKQEIPSKGLIIILLTLVAAWILSLVINANLFSMHSFYRNRLSNAYLAASNKQYKDKDICRDPDVGSHTTDAIPLSALADTKPYLIINTALNLVGGKVALEWQDRKAASFIMSPLYCGYTLNSMDNSPKECFQCTNSYAYRNITAYIGKKETPPNEHYLKLDLAMTISGAAGSPLGGFHTQPGVSMLMALAGVRLGWWLSNPAHTNYWQGDDWGKKDKTWQFKSDTPLLTTFPKEMMGSADDEGEKVYLSDGGHFENLSIYELVRRRCALIVASDAGEDDSFSFDDLAGSIHRIRVDFGVEIEIDDIAKLRPQKTPSAVDSKEFPAQDRFSTQNFVLGKIKYSSSAKPEFENKEDGVLIYIKSALPLSAKSRGIDVLNYAAMNPLFPHESTMDQWFSEDQFEAYRKIGFLIGEDVVPVIYIKLACMYGYQVKLILKEGQTFEGKVIDVHNSGEWCICLEIDGADTKKPIELTKIAKLEVLTPDARFSEVVFD